MVRGMGERAGVQGWLDGAPNRRKGMAGIAAIVVFVVAIGVMMAITGSGSGDDGPAGDSPAVQRAAAERACQTLVRDQLKSPSSAKFTGVTSTGSGPWEVTGSVDADNSFGASLRSDWECTIRLEGEDLLGSARVLP